MKPILEFGTKRMQVADKGAESSVPSIFYLPSVQNRVSFDLSETDEIYQAYGRVPNIYPYRKYDNYSRETREREVFTAVLENDALRAEFIPEFGGRLWSLIDKKTGRNLLYTNDVIRPSNIAERNAWFSGGVEWNIGVIGHSPLTMEPMFTARLEHEGMPILRMYEYERIRGVVYQMDFWLEPQGTVLNCKMRIVNETDEVLPMYWWSNIAVEEYVGGRIIAPADQAFTNANLCICKVEMPIVDGIDVSKYCDIPLPIDYFFDIPKNQDKYIANLNADGYGLLHTSTDRLQSRKLFSWGSCSSADRWQEFLTQDAGRYIEIQAGLAKTQYGCIPMAPRTAWEWVEQYGAVQAGEGIMSAEYSQACREMNGIVAAQNSVQDPEDALERSRLWTKRPARVVMRASGYADLENKRRAADGDTQLSPHLDFASADIRQGEFAELLETGKFPKADPRKAPLEYMLGEEWRAKLELAVKAQDEGNWAAHLHLGLMYYQDGALEKAENEFELSLRLEENAWAYYALANVYMQRGENRRAVAAAVKGVSLQKDDLAYVKTAFALLLATGGSEELLEIMEELPAELAGNARLQLCKIEALYNTGEKKQAFELLCRDGGIEVDDIAEGDDILTRLWTDLCEPKGTPIPQKLNFQFA